MRKIKNRLVIIIITMIAIITFTNCDNEETSNIGNSKNYIESLKAVGIEHNNGLNYVLQELQKLKSEGKLDLSSVGSILSLTREKTKDFLGIDNTVINSDNRDLAVEFSGYSFDWVENNYNSTWYTSTYAELTPKQKNLLGMLDKAIDDPTLDLNATLDVFKNVREKTMECSEEERIVIIAAIEIGTNSLKYWSENMSKWSELFSSRSKRWFNWKKLVKSDLKGAASGAVGGAFSGGLAGAGAGALGGGLGASAGSAVSQLWDHWFGD